MQNFFKIGHKLFSKACNCSVALYFQIYMVTVVYSEVSTPATSSFIFVLSQPLLQIPSPAQISEKVIIDSCCFLPLAGSLKPFSDSNYGR